MYKAHELIFTIIKDEDDGFWRDVPGASQYCVFISDLDTWKRYGCAGDDIGGHNIPSNLLKPYGIEDCEEMESIFRILSGYGPEEVQAHLQYAGLHHTEEFTNFIRRCGI